MENRVKNTTNYLIKQLPKATAYVSLNLNIIHISDSWINTFEFSRNLIFDTDILNVFPSLGKKWKQDIEYALLGSKNSIKTDKYFDANDSPKWLEWVITPWYDENENILGAIIQIEDVSHQKELEQKLEKLEILLNVKSEIGKIGSWEYNAITDKLTWCNITRLIHEVPFDYSPNIETAIKFYKEGYSRKLVAKNVDKAMSHGISWNEKLQLVTAKGNEIWIQASVRLKRS